MFLADSIYVLFWPELNHSFLGNLRRQSPLLRGQHIDAKQDIAHYSPELLDLSSPLASVSWVTDMTRACLAKTFFSYFNMNSVTDFFFFLFEYFEHSMGCCYLVANSCPTLRTHELQHTRLLCPSLSPGVCSNLMLCPLSWWCHPTILSFPTYPSPPALNLFRYQDLLQWVGFSHRVAKVLELQLQPQSF